MLRTQAKKQQGIKTITSETFTEKSLEKNILKFRPFEYIAVYNSIILALGMETGGTYLAN